MDVFRPSKEVPAIAADTIKIGAKVLWLQLGIRSEEAKELMETNNIWIFDEDIKFFNEKGFTNYTS